MTSSYQRRPGETARGLALRIANGLGTDDPPTTAEVRQAWAILEPCHHLSEAMLAAAQKLHPLTLARSA